MKSKCLKCREENAKAESARHPSDSAVLSLYYMRTPRAVKNNKPCERHGGKKTDEEIANDRQTIRSDS